MDKIKFVTPEISHKKPAEYILKSSNYMGCDIAFGTIFIWRNAYNINICIKDNFILRRYGREKFKFGFPVGNGDLKNIVLSLDKYCENLGMKLTFIGLTEVQCMLLDEILPNTFRFTENRDSSDYIYTRKNLAELKGTKYHSKRNHISKFMRLYGDRYKIEEITAENIFDVLEVDRLWRFEKGIGNTDEKTALDIAVNNFSDLDFKGIILYVDNKPVAMTMGEEICRLCFNTHFEKALAEYSGSFTFINNIFAKDYLTKYQYINREEDLGIEGLRKAKLSYNPDILLRKFVAEKIME